MATFLQIKAAVSNTLGRSDTTANAIRDNIINEVRQYDIANAYPFSWLETSTDLTTSSVGVVDLPANFNITHKPKLVIDSDDNVFTQVPKEVFYKYDSGAYVYYISYNTSTDRWQLITTEDDCALTVIYYMIPETLSEDIDIDIIPDLIVIKYLASARFWLSSERDETNFDRFNTMGVARLNMLIDRDKKMNPTRPKNYNFLSAITSED